MKINRELETVILVEFICWYNKQDHEFMKFLTAKEIVELYLSKVNDENRFSMKKAVQDINNSINNLIKLIKS